ncbi:MFS transporter [Streptococcus sp. HF-1907]|uniref:MFS transporter n=1 Tax=Streptococcus sp. HF-1907 TaxID=2785793 RepID=UPI00189CA9B2|nr:MFS transporter [Streptococcus sp. HF-1907]MBF7094295.1 MFS transporter [Streptococcus sp. HF-1907]
MKKTMEKVSLLSLSLMLVSTFSPSTALPQMITHFKSQGVSASQVESLFSISSFAILGMLVLTPWLSKVLSERLTVICGLVLIAFGGSMPLVWQSYPLMLVSRILLGVGIGFINARAINIISENYQGQERVRLLGLRGSFEVLGNAILTALVGFLIAFGWSKAFVIYLFALPILVLYLAFAPRHSVKKSEDSEHPKARFTAKDLLYIIGLALLAGFVINVNSANSLRIPVLVDSLKLGTASQASLALSAMMLMGIVAGVCFGPLMSGLKKYLTPLALIFFAGSLLLIAKAPNLLLLTAGAMLSGFLYSLVVTSAFTLVSEKMAAPLIGTATTIVLFFCNLGGASAAIVLKLFKYLNPNPSAAFLYYALISVVIGVIYLLTQLVTSRKTFKKA